MTYMESNLDDLKIKLADRNEFATRADVYRIQKAIEQETIRLASKDGASVLQWVDNLKEAGHYVTIKTASDPSPPDAALPLAHDSFVLIIQTRYQRECWQKLGKNFAGVDATHNTTHYENMSLFSLMVRDKWGHGKCM
jgi:capsular polysaccharide biosynthesis protein